LLRKYIGLQTKDSDSMKKKKDLFLIILPILLTIFYFAYAVTITWDSAHYMSYVSIFEKTLPFNSWDVVRGPIFPVVIYLSNFLFGKTVQGLLINSYIYYLLMLFFSYKILNKTISNNKRKTKIILFSLLLIIFNPIIYGYYHVLLTEFIAMTFAVVSCYLAYKMLEVDFSNKKNFVIYLLIFIFLTIFSWFLKQPYVSVSVFPLLVASIIKFFKREKMQKKIPIFLTVLFCLFGLCFSIGIWNSVLEDKGVNSDVERNPTTSLGNTLISAINYFEIEDCEDGYSSELDFLNKDEVIMLHQHIENNDDTYKIINIYDKNNKIIDREFVDLKDENISTFTSLKIIIKNFFIHPFLIIDSYFSNYLAISNFYATTNENSNNYKIVKDIDLYYVNELSSIGLKPYTYTSNIFYITDDAYQRVVNYEQFNHAPKILNYFMLFFGKVAIVLFKVLFICLPLLFIVSLIKRIKTRENRYDMLLILFGYGLLHMLLHVVTGAIIDRYAMPAYITTILGVIILINLIKKKEVKK